MKEFEYVAPESLAEATAVLARHGERARILSGGTDIIVQVREGRREVDYLVDIKHIAEVNELSYDAGKGLSLGSAVPCYRIAEHADIRRVYPGLVDAASLIGGIQIQSRASLGGNLCNASPAADGIPPLIALQATCVIGGPTGLRELPVEQFCTAPGRTALQKGEMLVSLRMPAPKPNSGSAYLRFIPRNEMDIAVVGVGASVTIDDQRQKCVAARIGLAAVAPTPLLASEAADSLVGTTLDEPALERAANLARALAKPISDMRGDADYRRHLVGVLVKRALRIALDRAKRN